MTRREQALICGIALAVCLGAGALYFRTAAESQEEPRIHRAETPAPLEKPQKVEASVLEREVSAPAAPPAAPEPPASPPSSQGVTDPAEAEPPEASEPMLAVSIGGAASEPGLYRLAKESRVQDLIDAAGGVRQDADLSDINVAAPLLDGTALIVPSRGQATRDGKNLVLRGGETAADLNPPQYTLSGWREAAPKSVEKAASSPTSVLAGTAAASSSGAIDLNTATQDMLESLPGIGPKTAEKIIAYRSRTPFRSVDDLNNVSGIGDKKLEAIRALVTVSGALQEVSSPTKDRGAPKKAVGKARK